MPDKMMRMSGRGKDGTAKAISTDDDGNLIVKNDFKAITVFDSIEIGSTDIFSSNLNLLGAKDITLLIRNTQNEEIDLFIQSRPDGISNIPTSTIKTLDMEDYSITIPNRYVHSGSFVVNKDQYPVLGALVSTLRFGARTTSRRNPTEGNVSIIMIYKEGAK